MDTSERAALALKNLPPFPPVAGKVIALLAGDAVSLQEIAATLKTDAALSAEVIRLANSALVSARYPVTNIPQALPLIGTTRLTGLLLTLSFSKFLKRTGPRDSIRRSWHHNLACALAAKDFAQFFGKDPDEAYNAGLFHDIGRLALLVMQPALYDQMLASGGDLLELERTHFGLDHCIAGAWVIEHWGLPKTFVDVALHHHAPQPEGSELTMVVHAACVVADRLGFSVIPAESDEIDVDPNDELGLSIAKVIHSLEREYGI
jgi:putative nucleotidyltransferase with HDIG domain